jgi:hypothetical protein
VIILLGFFNVDIYNSINKRISANKERLIYESYKNVSIKVLREDDALTVLVITGGE